MGAERGSFCLLGGCGERRQQDSQGGDQEEPGCPLFLGVVCVKTKALHQKEGPQRGAHGVCGGWSCLDFWGRLLSELVACSQVAS